MFGNEIDLENPISNSLIMALIDNQKDFCKSANNTYKKDRDMDFQL